MHARNDFPLLQSDNPLAAGDRLFARVHDGFRLQESGFAIGNRDRPVDFNAAEGDYYYD